jgi:hypothetical protein
MPLLTDFAVAVRYDDLVLPERADLARYLGIVEEMKNDLYSGFPPQSVPF